jgi:predicted small lipoprotein YifL
LCTFATENLINKFFKRSTMKKVFAILSAVVFLTAMSACGGSTPAPVAPEEPQVEEPATPPCNEVQTPETEAEVEVEVEEAQD